MKKTLSENDFLNEVERWETRKDSFSKEGWRALFRYIEDYESGTGEESELDIVALCCEFSEYESAWDAMKEYQPEDMPVVDLQAYSDENDGEGMDLLEVQEESEKMAREWLEEHTTVIDVEGGGVIVRQF